LTVGISANGRADTQADLRVKSEQRLVGTDQHRPVQRIVTWCQGDPDYLSGY